MSEKPYQCHVSIDVEASSPQEAAEYAEECLRDPECRGWVVHVQAAGERAMLIDNTGELAPKYLALPPEFTPRELATVLAALRWWQKLEPEVLELPQEAQELYLIAENDGEFEAMNGAEIDDLCERLNCK